MRPRPVTPPRARESSVASKNLPPKAVARAVPSPKVAKAVQAVKAAQNTPQYKMQEFKSKLPSRQTGPKPTTLRAAAAKAAEIRASSIGKAANQVARGMKTENLLARNMGRMAETESGARKSSLQYKQRVRESNARDLSDTLKTLKRAEKIATNQRDRVQRSADRELIRDMTKAAKTSVRAKSPAKLPDYGLPGTVAKKAPKSQAITTFQDLSKKEQKVASKPLKSVKGAKAPKGFKAPKTTALPDYGLPGTVSKKAAKEAAKASKAAKAPKAPKAPKMPKLPKYGLPGSGSGGLGRFGSGSGSGGMGRFSGGFGGAGGGGGGRYGSKPNP